MTSDASHAMVDHPDHQDAIVFEKLKLLKISFSKPEKKQAVVVVLNTDAWLSGSVVGVFGGLCFFSESWRFWFTLPALLSLAVIESCRSTSATTRFKLASSTAFQNFNAHFAQTPSGGIAWIVGNGIGSPRSSGKTFVQCVDILSPFCPLNDHLQSQQQSPEHDASSV